MVDHRKEYDAGRLATTDGSTPKVFAAPAPDPDVKDNGQHASYWVLSESERAKGFVRPVRRSYIHEKCGTLTTMGVALAETYARQPGFYGATFCCECRGHFPVGAHGEFTWAGAPGAAPEKVGT